MTTTTERQIDRRDAVEYAEAAMHLAAFARSYAALRDQVVEGSSLSTFGPTVANHLRGVYDDLATYFTTAAEQADDLARDARLRLGAA